MADRNGLAAVLREFGLAVLGITLTLTILAIWVSVTPTMLVVVYAIMGTAGVLYCVLYAYHCSLAGDRPNLPAAERRKVPTDKIVAEVLGFFPATYHHRRIGDPYSHRNARLRSLMYDDEAEPEEEETEL